MAKRTQVCMATLKQAEQEARNLFAAICKAIDVMQESDPDREWMRSMLRDAQALSGNIEHVIEWGGNDDD